VLFVGVGGEFLRLLPEGFEAVKVGREPWIRLDSFMPTGNAGRGVRAARNQAIRAGVWIEEWPASAVATRPELRAEIVRIQASRCRQRIWQWHGFLNALDPFAIPEDRRYFVARSAAGLEGYLIATRIEGERSYFFEDTMLRRGAPRGAGELLTLEAMRMLRESGSEKVSLGVVSSADFAFAESDASARPLGLTLAMLALRKLAPMFYDTRGVELYRKRFKPAAWTDSFLALAQTGRPGHRPGVTAWLRAMLALAWAFEPKLAPSREGAWGLVTSPLRKHPITAGWLATVTAVFLLVAHATALSPAIVEHLGFLPSAPLWQWPLRSLTSDLLFFTPRDFLINVALMVPLCALLERKLPTRVLLPFMLAFWMSDDLLNYLLVTLPLKYVNHPVYEGLLRISETGSSLLLMGLLGLAVYQARRYRDLLLGALSLCVVFGLIFNSFKFQDFILHANCLLFLMIGYAFGAAYFAKIRRHSRAVAKGATPRLRYPAAQESPWSA
jgi:hypothetical protein